MRANLRTLIWVCALVAVGGATAFAQVSYVTSFDSERDRAGWAFGGKDFTVGSDYSFSPRESLIGRSVGVPGIEVAAEYPKISLKTDSPLLSFYCSIADGKLEDKQLLLTLSDVNSFTTIKQDMYSGDVGVACGGKAWHRHEVSLDILQGKDVTIRFEISTTVPLVWCIDNLMMFSKDKTYADGKDGVFFLHQEVEYPGTSLYAPIPVGGSTLFHRIRLSGLVNPLSGKAARMEAIVANPDSGHPDTWDKLLVTKSLLLGEFKTGETNHSFLVDLFDGRYKWYARSRDINAVNPSDWTEIADVGYHFMIDSTPWNRMMDSQTGPTASVERTAYRTPVVRSGGKKRKWLGACTSSFVERPPSGGQAVVWVAILLFAIAATRRCLGKTS